MFEVLNGALVSDNGYELCSCCDDGDSNGCDNGFDNCAGFDDWVGVNFVRCWNNLSLFDFQQNKGLINRLQLLIRILL